MQRWGGGGFYLTSAEVGGWGIYLTSAEVGGWVIYLTSAEFDHIYVPVFSPTPRSVFDHVRGVKVTITVSEQKFA